MTNCPTLLSKKLCLLMFATAVCITLLVGTIGRATASPETRLIASSASYPEGPFLYNGKLYFVEYGGSNLNVWDGKTVKLVWHQDGCGANSAINTSDGHFLIACYDANKVVKIDPSGKTINSFETDKDGVPLNGPNDFAMDNKGGVYFTTSGKFDWQAPINGKVFYIDPDGSFAMVADTLHFANGVALVDGGKTLLVGEYMAGRIVSFEITAKGRLSDQRFLFASITDIAATPEGSKGYPGPDGIKIDSKGRIYIAQYGTGRVLVVDRAGKLIRTISVPAGSFTTNIALSLDEQSIYVTTTYDDTNSPYPGAVYQLPNE